MKRTICFVAVFVGLVATSAHAANTRTWISGKGTDQASCGPIATPCRTLQYAHDNTVAGGQVDVLDSAGYGAVIINKAITIVGDGTIAGVLAVSGGNAIKITAGASDAVVLRGLTIDGSGIGETGIQSMFNGKLDISNCVVQNFVSNGLQFLPTAGTPSVAIKNTTISNNGATGLTFSPAINTSATANLILDHIIVSDNAFNGLAIGSSPSGATTFSISNSLVANNGSEGIGMGAVTAFIDQTSVIHNGDHGIFLSSGQVTIGRSVSANNASLGVFISGGSGFSYRDNRISGNGEGAGSTLTAAPLL